MPQSPLIILNPTAGGGRAGRLAGWVSERLAARPDARFEITRRAGHAEELAAEAPGKHDRVIAVGGDGTIQEVMNGLVNGEPAASIGIVPVGSGNDLARSLGLPRDPAVAWTIALGSAERSLDLALATRGDGRTRWFGSAGGIGFDAQVAAAMATRSGWRRGQAGYLAATLTELRRFSNRRIELTIDGIPRETRALFVAIANGEYYGGGMRVAPGASIDDGMLDLCIVGDISRLTALRQLANLYRGTHVNHPQVEMAQGHSIEIEGDPDTLTHLDGEPFGSLPLAVRLRPAAIRVAARDGGPVG